MRARELPVIEVAPRLAPAPLPEVADDVLPAGPEEYGPRTVPDVAEPDLDGAPADAAPDVDAAPDMDAAPPRAPPAPREALPELAAAPPPVVEWPPDQQRRILALRLVAPLAERFAGRSLRQALAAEGFVLGPFAIFHKPNEERRAVLSAASLTRPGTFDMDTMDSQHYGGLSLFAVLPGPKPPPQAFEELVFTARNLSERLHGVLQDEHGSPLTAARIALLREQLRSSTAAS
jgi:cell division protein ZipA